MTSDRLREMADKYDIGALLAQEGQEIVRLLADSMEQMQEMKNAGYTGLDWLLDRFAALGKLR